MFLSSDSRISRSYLLSKLSQVPGTATGLITERASGRGVADSFLNDLGRGIAPILPCFPFHLLRSPLTTSRFFIALLVVVKGNSDMQLISCLCLHHHPSGLGTHDIYDSDHHPPVINLHLVDYLRMGYAAGHQESAHLYIISCLGTWSHLSYPQPVRPSVRP